MLSSETKIVTYVNKKGERSTYPLSSAMESANLEMVKRLKYTKDILTHMLNNNNPQSQQKSGVTGIDGQSNVVGNTMSNTQSQSSRPKTMTMGSGIESSKNATGSVNKFSATDRMGGGSNMGSKAYQTS